MSVEELKVRVFDEVKEFLEAGNDEAVLNLKKALWAEYQEQRTAYHELCMEMTESVKTKKAYREVMSRVVDIARKNKKIN